MKIMVTEYRTERQSREFPATVPDNLDLDDSQALADAIIMDDLDTGAEWKTTDASEWRTAERIPS